MPVESNRLLVFGLSKIFNHLTVIRKGLLTLPIVEVPVTGQGFWFEEIALGLGVWVGRYQGFSGQWLRWYDSPSGDAPERSGNWIPAFQERAEQAEDRAAQAEERAARLAAKLRKLGISED